MTPRELKEPIVIVGAGMGGLAAAAWLAKRGRRVLVLEARDGPGGLASGCREAGCSFDAGPYILLDRPGLEWAFRQLGEELSFHVTLERLDHVYQVELEDGPTITMLADLQATAQQLDETWPGYGVGERYSRFVERMGSAYNRLRALQYISEPSPGAILRYGAISQVPFLLQSLSSVLSRAGFPRELTEALSIWTHVAGQSAGDAPSPMAFVPALIHNYGAYVPRQGMSEVPLALESIARQAGVEFRYGTLVREINCHNGRISSVKTGDETILARAVISNASVIGTYLNLLKGAPVSGRFLGRLRGLPLQSPGVCAYLSVEYKPALPSRSSTSASVTSRTSRSYLRFRLPRKGLCRLLIQPRIVSEGGSGTARLLGPVSHDWAKEAGPEGQRDYLERLLQESWWQDDFAQARMVAHNLPYEWGERYCLYDSSMNPVMTSRLMRQGRLPHKSPFVDGLYFAGSATHPGQWVSFCAISGVLAAREVARSFGEKPSGKKARSR